MTTDSLDVQLAEWQAQAAKSNAEAAHAQQRILELKAQRSTVRWSFFGYCLSGLAVVVVILGIVGALWLNADRGGERSVERERARVDTVEACLTLPDAAERQLCVALLDADVDKPE